MRFIYPQPGFVRLASLGGRVSIGEPGREKKNQPYLYLGLGSKLIEKLLFNS
jgi:hypothetical protein